MADGVDINKLTTGDRVIGISAIVFLISMFLPWFGLDTDFGDDISESGWSYFLGWIALVLAIAMVVQIAISRFSTTQLPKIGALTWGQIHVILGGLAAAAMLLRIVLVPDVEVLGVDIADADRKYGVFIAFLAALGLLAGAFLKMRDPADAGGAAGPASPPPSAPPPPTA
jgi:hypothetical protein